MISPNCDICEEEDLSQYPHHYHTTDEHDRWYEYMTNPTVLSQRLLDI